MDVQQHQGNNYFVGCRVCVCVCMLKPRYRHLQCTLNVNREMVAAIPAAVSFRPATTFSSNIFFFSIFSFFIFLFLSHVKSPELLHFLFILRSSLSLCLSCCCCRQFIDGVLQRPAAGAARLAKTITASHYNIIFFSSSLCICMRFPRIHWIFFFCSEKRNNNFSLSFSAANNFFFHY